MFVHWFLGVLVVVVCVAVQDMAVKKSAISEEPSTACNAAIPRSCKRLERDTLDVKLASRRAWKGEVEPKMGQDGPKMGPRWFQEMFCGIVSMFGAPFLVHLGLSWAFLGRSRGVQGGISRQILGLGGWRLASDVANK